VSGASICIDVKLIRSAIVIGCPPAYRGGTTKGTDLEIQLLKLFPKTAYFIEKVRWVKQHQTDGLLTPARRNGNGPGLEGGHGRVGQERKHRLGRIHAAIPPLCAEDEADHPREQLDRHGDERAIRKWRDLQRWDQADSQSCAYEAIAKPAWWNKAIDMGPVIEQGTHFCDLSRYFGGDVDINSVV
jgi:hypothetical protein